MAIFTIGYGGRGFVNFIVLLKEHDIAFVGDVRRFPKSKVPEYNKESLLHLPKSLSRQGRG